MLTYIFKQLILYFHPCEHKILSVERWNDKDNTPMLKETCHQCNLVVTNSHVYGPPWEPDKLTPRMIKQEGGIWKHHF